MWPRKGEQILPIKNPPDPSGCRRNVQGYVADGERRQRKDLLDGVSVQNVFSNTDSWDWLGINHRD